MRTEAERWNEPTHPSDFVVAKTLLDLLETANAIPLFSLHLPTLSSVPLSVHPTSTFCMHGLFVELRKY